MATHLYKLHLNHTLRLLSMLITYISAISCGYITEKSEPYISKSGSGEFIINNDTPIDIERVALQIYDTTLELHLMGSLCTMDSEGNLLGKGTSIIATLLYTEQLETTSVALGEEHSMVYSTQIENSTRLSNYTKMEHGTLIIRENQGAYDIQATCQDEEHNYIITSYSGFLYRTIDMRK